MSAVPIANLNLPLSVKQVIRDNFEEPDSSLNQIRKRVTDLVGVEYRYQLEWESLCHYWNDHQPRGHEDYQNCIQRITSCVQAFLLALEQFLGSSVQTAEYEKLVDEYLELTKAGTISLNLIADRTRANCVFEYGSIRLECPIGQAQVNMASFDIESLIRWARLPETKDDPELQTTNSPPSSSSFDMVTLSDKPPGAGQMPDVNTSHNTAKSHVIIRRYRPFTRLRGPRGDFRSVPEGITIDGPPSIAQFTFEYAQKNFSKDSGRVQYLPAAWSGRKEVLLTSYENDFLGLEGGIAMLLDIMSSRGYSISQSVMNSGYEQYILSNR